MKSLLLVVMGLLLIGSVANAAEILSDDATGTPGVLIPDNRLPYSLTQNANPTTLTTSMYACGNAQYSYLTEGWSLRRLSLTWEFAITTPIEIQNVQWGIRRYACYDSILPYGTVQLPCNLNNPPFILDMNLYALPDDQPLTFAAMGAPFASAQIPVTEALNPISPVTGTPMTTVFPAGTCIDPYIDGNVYKDLVVAIHNRSTELDPYFPTARYFTSANALGETSPSYVAFADCGAPEPITPFALGGSTTQHMVLIVNAVDCVPPVVTGACCTAATGACTVLPEAECLLPATWLGPDIPCDIQHCPLPVPAEIKSWGQVKSLYR